MILVYIRHGIAMDREAFARYCIENGIEADDERRPLTEEGKRKTKRSVAGLMRALKSVEAVGASGLSQEARRELTRKSTKKKLSPLPAFRPLIISSPMLRARQTAGILAQGFSKSGIRMRTKEPLETPTLSPMRHPQEFRDFLYSYMHSDDSHRVHATTVVIAVGHEPHLGQSVAWWVMGESRPRFPFKKGGATCLEIGGALAHAEARLLWALPPWALREMAPRVRV
jgi:phosphohistidine phosphatase SixA